MVKALKTTLRRMVLQLSPEGTWDLWVLSEKDHRGCSEEAELEGERLEAGKPVRELLRKLRDREDSRQEGVWRVRDGRYEGGETTSQ